MNLLPVAKEGELALRDNTAHPNAQIPTNAKNVPEIRHHAHSKIALPMQDPLRQMVSPTRVMGIAICARKMS